jgi:hypothetical protein
VVLFLIASCGCAILVPSHTTKNLVVYKACHVQVYEMNCLLYYILLYCIILYYIIVVIVCLEVEKEDWIWMNHLIVQRGQTINSILQYIHGQKMNNYWKQDWTMLCCQYCSYSTCQQYCLALLHSIQTQQYFSMLLTTMNNVGSKTLLNPVEL